jgi:hypothetical protein
MAEIEDQFLGHPARNQLKRLGSLLDQLLDEQRDQVEELGRVL